MLIPKAWGSVVSIDIKQPAVTKDDGTKVYPENNHNDYMKYRPRSMGLKSDPYYIEFRILLLDI